MSYNLKFTLCCLVALMVAMSIAYIITLVMNLRIGFHGSDQVFNNFEPAEERNGRKFGDGVYLADKYRGSRGWGKFTYICLYNVNNVANGDLWDGGTCTPFNEIVIRDHSSVKILFRIANRRPEAIEQAFDSYFGS